MILSKLRYYTFRFIFFIITINQILLPNILYNLNPTEQIDEIVYSKIVSNWNINGIQTLITANDDKPLPFLFLQKLFLADKTTLYTRLLNMFFVLLNTYLIYSLTKRQESFLYPLIPIFLNSMWLTTEIIESFFLILLFKYQSYSGLFIGLSTMFRPYSLIFSITQKSYQFLFIIIPGFIFSGLLLYYNLFFPYLKTVLDYGSSSSTTSLQSIDIFVFTILILFAIIGTKNKQIFTYGLIACLPLLLRHWGHYFITPYTLFFFSYLYGDETT